MRKMGRNRVMPRGSWLSRFVRGVRPDRNPVRRSTDRLETLIFAGSVVAAAAAAPFVVPAAADAGHAAAVNAQNVQRTTRHQVEAALTQRAADGGIGYPPATEVLTQAAWHAPDGIPRSGVVTAPAGAAKGSLVHVWTDPKGNLTAPPLDAGQIAGQADLGGAAAAGGLALLLLAEAVIVRRILDRRRMSEWDDDWALTEPQWTRSRWQG